MKPDLENYLNALTDSTSLEEIWRFHCTALASYGFDRILYGFTRFLSEKSLGPIEDAVILSNHNPMYLKRFTDEGHYKHAPMTRWSFANVGACSWSWIAENKDSLTDNELAVVAFNKSMGVTAGFTQSFVRSSTRAHGVVALAGRPDLSQDDVDAIWARHGHEIELMNKVAHLKITSMPQPNERPGLSRRQREVLEWVGDGKTNQDIATIIGVTAATVEKHLRIAREKLDVETTAQAVLKASFQNQMFVLHGDPHGNVIR